MIHIKTEEDIQAMEQGGHILALVLDRLVAEVRPGIHTGTLNTLAKELILKAGCRPAFEGYQQRPGDIPFPDVICTSINDEVVHGIASRELVLKAGDILSIDIGLKYQGRLRSYFLDMARSVEVGTVSADERRLLSFTEKALIAGIQAIQPGRYVHDISSAIERMLRKGKLGIIRDLVGHGVGYQLHEDPCIFNYVDERIKRESVQLQPGMVLALEPMATLGGHEVILDADGWTIRTKDGSKAVQFEHTVAVTKDGYKILTKKEGEI